MFKLIVVIAFFAAVVYFNVTRTDKGLRIRPRIFPTLLAVVALFVLFPLFDSFGIVPAGDTGVVTQFGGVVPGDLKREGLYFVVPGIQAVHVMDTKPHKIELNDAEAVTSDRQEVHTSVTLLVQVDPATADRTYDQYRDTLVDQVVMPKFQEAVKTITAKYDAATQVRNRGAVQAEMLGYVAHELANKGVIIGPGALSIINFTYNRSYQDAIEQTAVSQQNLVKAQAQLNVNTIEAQQRVVTARGEAQAQAPRAHDQPDVVAVHA
ncbi:MAG: prohibitin family protein, partial [Candidatus Eremiobacteraeota bacterium]|nr:prohibitin family protein [Candidatus Eremiobacteraeota bacterium]